MENTVSLNNESSDYLVRVTFVGGVVNLVLSFLKILSGIYGKSAGLLADGIHSLSDLLSDVIVYLGLRISEKPADEKRNYGYSKVEDLSGFILGGILGVTAWYIGMDSAKAIYTHRENFPEKFTILVTLLSVITKEWLYFYTLKAGKKTGNQMIIANAWHHRSDSFSSIAVLIGLGVALWNPDYHIVDAYMGLMVSFIILKVGMGICWDSVKKLIDTAPGEEIRKFVVCVVKHHPQVRSFHNLQMRFIGGRIYIEVHLLADPQMSLYDSHEITQEVENRLLSELKNIYRVNIHMEPFEEEKSQIATKPETTPDNPAKE